MSSGQMTVLVATAAAVVLVLVVLLVVLVQGRRARRRTEVALAASRAEIVALQERLDALTAPPAAPPEPRHRAGEREFVITTAGTPSGSGDVDVSAPPPVDARQFASVALGESVVRLVSLGYGVRRALSAENRNRIAFEMRREVRRSRKDRRRELRDLRRKLRDEPGPADRPGDAEESAA